MLDEAGFDDVRVDGLGSLVGRLGRGGRTLAVDAHVDTVDPGDAGQWEGDPFSGRTAGGFLWGRGSVDQKGGAASMVTAGRILRELVYDGAFTLAFTFTVMEEDCEGLCWNYLIERENLHPTFAVLTEPTNLGVYRGHRGRLEIELFFAGVSSHGSAPERGVNAVYAAADAVREIRDLNGRLREDEFLGRGSVAVTRIESNSPSLCSVPDRCTIHLDRRLTRGESLESALGEVRGMTGGGGGVEVPFYDGESHKGARYGMKKYFPAWQIPGDHVLVRSGVETFSRLFGKAPEVGKWGFSTNGVSICGTHGIPAIGFGPGNEVFAHAPNERVPVEDLVKASAFYALLPFVLEEQETRKQ
jgi:putative selenium metabolism hydrolase